MSTNAEFIKEIDEAYDLALDIVKSEGWKKEKYDKDTDTLVELKKTDKGRKIYRGKSKINISPKALAEVLKNTDTVKEWNTTLAEAKTLIKLDDKHQITYQVTQDSAGGLVSSRDFVYGSKFDYTSGPTGEIFVMGGKSVDYPDAPKVSKIVRAINGAGCQMVIPVEGEDEQCEVIWLMDCDFKGWMPGSVLDIAMPVAQTQFFDSLRTYAAKSAKK